jgi:uncharacterized protein
MEAELSPRDRRLFGPGPKRILSLDGGGVRGIVSIAFLEELERRIDTIEGRATCLCDWFDLIGGTSTGAIIATALALGLRVAEVRALYEELAPSVFRRSRLRLAGWQAKYDARPLMAELLQIIGDRTLDSADLGTGYGILLKRLDTGSSWTVLNNPRSKFWETPEDGSFTGNRHLSIAELVRASTAAPSYFDPEAISLSDRAAAGIFVDGGVTPHNNPSLALLLTALLPAHGLQWRVGPEQLMIVSVGTGAFRPTMSVDAARKSSAIALALRSLAAMVAEDQCLVLTLMTYLGRSPVPWPINSEIGDLGALTGPAGDLFQYLRYDIRLDARWLAEHAGATLSQEAVAALQPLDQPANMSALYDLAQAVASKQIQTPDLMFPAKS